MVQVNVDIAPASRAELGQPIEVFGVILVLREKAGVLRHAARRIAKAAESPWVLGDPAIDACERRLVAGTVATRFKVIADGDEDVERFVVGFNRIER